jgi:hypothetical protein
LRALEAQRLGCNKNVGAFAPKTVLHIVLAMVSLKPGQMKKRERHTDHAHVPID